MQFSDHRLSAPGVGAPTRLEILHPPLVSMHSLCVAYSMVGLNFHQHLYTLWSSRYIKMTQLQYWLLRGQQVSQQRWIWGIHCTQVTKHAIKGSSAPGFETQGRHYQKSRTGTSVASKYLFKKKNRYNYWLETNNWVIRFCFQGVFLYQSFDFRVQTDGTCTTSSTTNTGHNIFPYRGHTHSLAKTNTGHEVFAQTEDTRTSWPKPTLDTRYFNTLV